MENYREFASFYEMKEWLKQGEYVLPAIYRTKNDGKYYFDYAVDISEMGDSFITDITNDSIQGFTLNENNEMSKVLCQIMDSHFTNKRKSFIEKDDENVLFNEHIVKSYDMNSRYETSVPNNDESSLVVKVTVDGSDSAAMTASDSGELVPLFTNLYKRSEVAINTRISTSSTSTMNGAMLTNYMDIPMDPSIENPVVRIKGLPHPENFGTHDYDRVCALVNGVEYKNANGAWNFVNFKNSTKYTKEILDDGTLVLTMFGDGLPYYFGNSTSVYQPRFCFQDVNGDGSALTEAPDLIITLNEPIEYGTVGGDNNDNVGTKTYTFQNIESEVPMTKGPITVNYTRQDGYSPLTVETTNGDNWSGEIDVSLYGVKDYHYVNKGVFNGDFQNFNMNMFRHFKHYGSVVKKTNEGINNQKFHNMILPHQFSNSNISEIVIPEGVEFIGGKAFENCFNLRKVKLPSTLKRIGRGAFKGCTALEEIYIPGSCKVIEMSAFHGCSSLSAVTFENGVEEIGERAFKYTNISSLFLPKSVHTIRAKAFANCVNLQKVYIGKNVHNLSNRPDKYSGFLSGTAFYNSDVEKFHVDSQNQYIKVGTNGELMMKHHGNWMIIKIPYSYEGALYVADDTAKIMICNLFEKSNVPSSITSINFNNIISIPKHCCNNRNINSVIMPHVHSISHNAFGNSYGITDVTIGDTSNLDAFQQDHIINLKQNQRQEDKKQLLRFNKDCRITLASNTMLSAYKTHELWKQYFPLTYVIISMSDQWRFSESLVNADTSKYYDTVESWGNFGIDEQAAVMKVYFNNISSYSFDFWSDSETNYDYVMVSQGDMEITNDTSYNNTSLVKCHSRGEGTNKIIAQYDNIPGGKHEITILYRKDSSDYEGEDRGFVRFFKNNNNKNIDIEIFLEFFEKYVVDGVCYFKSTNEGLDSTPFGFMRVYFRNNPNFTIHVASDSEAGYDFLAVSPLDTSHLEWVRMDLRENADWLFTTLYNYYVLENGPTDKDSYYELNIPNDGEYHFIEIYYLKDSSQSENTDSGYVIIPGIE